MGIFKELQDRGLVAQMTNPEMIEKLLEEDKISFYIGFDPTADSLHVGHFMQMVIMKHLQGAGHRPIAILGEGTGMIGDPSGRTDMRKMLTHEQVQHNIACFKKQMGRFIDTSEDKALFVNNADWLLHLNYVDFLRDIGVHFSVNKMLSYECFKSRMERGLTFIEFNYMLMQAYDFYMLYKKYGCVMEMGGDDQWANILAGIDLVRKKEGKEVYGITFNLLTTSDGKKMGKTQKGAVWLDPDKTSPYEFFQYWRNIEDADVIRMMKMITFMPLEEIAEYEKLKDAEINRAKEKLAFELTKMVHGEEEANKALNAAKALFVGGGDLANMPSTTLTEEDFTDGKIGILDLLCKTKLAPSKAEGRRLVQQNGISVNDQKVTDIAASYDKDAFAGDFLIKKGKKVYHKVTL
ncbi:MAG: tyrosine--tRNA ligase [Eubacteriales bacterium]|jgi:tyrosyl-tRNA synthetase